jgi:hypothetical protein
MTPSAWPLFVFFFAITVVGMTQTHLHGDVVRPAVLW